MPLNKKQKAAIKSYVDSLVVAPGTQSFQPGALSGLVGGLDDALLRFPPWRDLLDVWELFYLLQERLSRFELVLPAGYVGSLGAMPDSTFRDSITSDLVYYLDSLPRSYYVCIQLDRFP